MPLGNNSSPSSLKTGIIILPHQVESSIEATSTWSTHGAPCLAHCVLFISATHFWSLPSSLERLTTSLLNPCSEWKVWASRPWHTASNSGLSRGLRKMSSFYPEFLEWKGVTFYDLLHHNYSEYLTGGEEEQVWKAILFHIDETWTATIKYALWSGSLQDFSRKVRKLEGRQSGQPRFRTRLSRSVVVWPWAHCLRLLSLSSLAYEIGEGGILCTSQGCRGD